jgi:hypothetical protein
MSSRGDRGLHLVTTFSTNVEVMPLDKTSLSIEALESFIDVRQAGAGGFPCIKVDRDSKEDADRRTHLSSMTRSGSVPAPHPIGGEFPRLGPWSGRQEAS